VFHIKASSCEIVYNFELVVNLDYPRPCNCHSNDLARTLTTILIPPTSNIYLLLAFTRT
jgi:hypothetical protein